MKSVLLALVVSMFLSALTACSIETESHESTPDILIEGKPARDFYAQFFYQPSESCPHPVFRMASNFKFGSSGSGLDMRLYIFPDGTYSAVYNLDSRSHKIENRNWKIQGREIIFEGLGVGNGYYADFGRSMMLEITANSEQLELIVVSRAEFVDFPELNNCTQE